MNIEAHKRAVKESLDVLEKAIERGLKERQRTIGFHCSVASVDILEIYLHENDLINPGTILKHNFFSSKKKVKERLDFDFEKREKIIEMMVKIEKKRNLLCYGKPRPEKEIENYILVFNKLRKIFDDLGVDYE